MKPLTKLIEDHLDNRSAGAGILSDIRSRHSDLALEDLAAVMALLLRGLFDSPSLDEAMTDGQGGATSPRDRLAELFAQANSRKVSLEAIVDTAARTEVSARLLRDFSELLTRREYDVEIESVQNTIRSLVESGAVAEENVAGLDPAVIATRTKPVI